MESLVCSVSAKFADLSRNFSKPQRLNELGMDYNDIGAFP